MARPRMSSLRVTLLAVALGVVLAAAGCGGAGTNDAGSGAGVAGASVLPEGTAIAVSIATDADGEQWQAAEALLERFPAGAKLVDEAIEELTEGKLDWEQDVVPALGPQATVGVLGSTDEDVVVVLQPDDPAKLAALVAQSEEDVVTAEVGDYTVLAESQATLDALTAARDKGTLDDSERFQEAVAGLDDDVLATIYVDGAAAATAAKSADAGAEAGQLQQLLPGSSALDWLSATIRAEPGGVRLQGFAHGEGAQASEPFASTLVSQLPAGAIAFVTFSGLESTLDQALKAMGQQDDEFEQQLAQIELALGLSVQDDLLPLFAGEGAIAVYPGKEIPAISLILSVDDEAKALATVDSIVQRVLSFAGTGGPKASQTDVAGVTATKVDFGQFALYYAAFDGKLVLTTSPDGIAGLREQGPKLAGDPDFAAARDAAEMPAETTGFVYVNVAKAADLADTLGMLADEPLPTDAKENLESLRGALVWADHDGERLSFSGFLGIE